jgi:hypothetical protein
MAIPNTVAIAVTNDRLLALPQPFRATRSGLFFDSRPVVGTRLAREKLKATCKDRLVKAIVCRWPLQFYGLLR